jgi:hypothetical protein
MRMDPVPFRVVVTYDNNTHLPRTHLVHPKASGPPWVVVCGRQVIGRLLSEAEASEWVQVPCPRCVRVASI